MVDLPSLILAAGKYDASEQHKIHSLDAGYFVENHLGPDLRDQQLTSSSQAAQNQLRISSLQGGHWGVLILPGEGTFLTYYEPDEALSHLDGPGGNPQMSERQL